MSNHYVQKCEQCGAVIAQCRCMSCDKTVIVKGLCAKCAAQPQDKGSAGQQSAIAAQQAKCAMLPCLGYLESECEYCVYYNLYRKP